MQTNIHARAAGLFIAGKVLILSQMWQQEKTKYNGRLLTPARSSRQLTTAEKLRGKLTERAGVAQYLRGSHVAERKRDLTEAQLY
jgi:hypothetical protein